MDRGGPYSIVVNGPGGGSIFNRGKWTGDPYSIVVNGPGGSIFNRGKWSPGVDNDPHLFSFIIGTYQAMILTGIILFVFPFQH